MPHVFQAKNHYRQQLPGLQDLRLTRSLRTLHEGEAILTFWCPQFGFELQISRKSGVKKNGVSLAADGAALPESRRQPWDHHPPIHSSSQLDPNIC